MPVPFTKDHLAVNPTDYTVAKKHDGERFQLVVASNSAAYVDRLGKFWKVHVEAPASMRMGSVFDGEILERSGCFVFMIFDVLLIDGVDVRQRDFGARQQFCQNLGSSLRHGYENSVHIDCVSKKIVDTAAIDELKADILPNDGFVLTHKYAPYGLFESQTMIKWKAVHTVDIELKDGVPVLYDSDQRQVRSLQDLISTFQCSEIQRFSDVSLWKLPQDFHSGVVECLVVVENGSMLFTYQLTRFDKRHGNSWQTLHNTVKVLMNYVDESRFVDWCKSASRTQAKRKKIS